jgi:N-acetylglucosaminyldiphosphoundecaprenol N-acetyl-beta-D-mannosaminyltransferase
MTTRFNILGIGVSVVNMQTTVDTIGKALENGTRGYVCVSPVHPFVVAQSDPVFRSIFNHSLLTVPDGMPIVWLGRLLGHRSIGRVYGPDLMLEIMRQSKEHGWTHFFYGGAEGVADELRKRMEERFPGIRVVGTYCPPFRPLTEKEEKDLQEMLKLQKPDFMWIGLGVPKQERFIAQYATKLDAKIMIGVGAAFDIHTGRLKDAPAWVKNAGMQWLHRLLQEPRRLWRRYLLMNPVFIILIILQLLHLKKFEISDKA